MTETTAATIRETYRELVLEMPFENIRVMDICSRAGVSRKTFYTYYSGKDELLEDIFYRDAFAETEHLLPKFPRSTESISVFLLTEKTYQGLLDHAEFYRRVVGRGSTRIFTEAVRRGVLRLQEALTGSMGLPADVMSADESLKFHYAQCFGGGAQAAIMVDWIRRGYDVSPQQLAEWTGEWSYSSGVVGYGSDAEASGVIPRLH